MVEMKCLKAMPYAGKNLKPGEVFNATSELDAHVLTVIGKAIRLNDEEINTQEILRTLPEVRKKRVYRRRDMTAQ